MKDRQHCWHLLVEDHGEAATVDEVFSPHLSPCGRSYGFVRLVNDLYSLVRSLHLVQGGHSAFAWKGVPRL